jgi:octopine/nopaline transport system substrate-binding protein
VKKTFAAVPALAVAALALAAVVSGAAPVVAKDWKTVRIATEGAYMPWNGTDTAGKLVGFEIDLAADLCKRIGVKCVVKAQDWDGIIPALQQGKYDAVMSGMSITDERRQLIDFSKPYVADPAIFAAIKGSPLLGAKVGTERIDLNKADAGKAVFPALNEAFKGKNIGVQVSTIHQTMMEKFLPGVTLRTYDKVDSMGLDLVSGRIDGLLADKSIVADLQKAPDGKNITMFGPGFVGGVLGEGIGVGLRKADADLKAMFDKAITAAAADGTTSKLAQKWFGFDIAVK